MRINVLNVVKDYEGKDITEGPKKTPVTYRAIFSGALNSMEEREIIPAEQKAQIFALSLKLFKSKEVDLTVEERTLIKERTAKFYTPLVYGRVSEALEESKESSKSLS